MEVQGTTNDLCGLWTNEKHVNFLNWMEDSFVRTMLEKNNDNNNSSSSELTYATSTGHGGLGGCGVAPPLDRYLPDSSESTRDLRYNNKKNSSTKTASRLHFLVPMGHQNKKTTSSSARTKDMMKMTCLSLRPYDASGDQVVPQLGKIKGDKKEEEKERLEVAPANNKNSC